MRPNRRTDHTRIQKDIRCSSGSRRPDHTRSQYRFLRDSPRRPHIQPDIGHQCTPRPVGSSPANTRPPPPRRPDDNAGWLPGLHRDTPGTAHRHRPAPYRPVERSPRRLHSRLGPRRKGSRSTSDRRSRTGYTPRILLLNVFSQFVSNARTKPPRIGNARIPSCLHPSPNTAERGCCLVNRTEGRAAHQASRSASPDEWTSSVVGIPRSSEVYWSWNVAACLSVGV